MKKLSVSMTRGEMLWGWIYMLLQLIALPSALILINFTLGNPLSDAAANFVYFGTNFICVTVIFRKFILDSFGCALNNFVLCIRAVICGFVLYYVASYITYKALIFLKPNFFNVNDESIFQMTRNNYALMGIGTVLLVPPVEEILYRGLIFRGLHSRSRILAYAVSTLAFCAIHVFGYIGLYDWFTLLLCLLQYVPAGICLACAYEQADTIAAPILIHMIINLIGILSMR